MAVPVLQLVELGLHGAAFLCGIVCASALTVGQGEFGGRCPLYGAVSWEGASLSPRAFGPPSLCAFAAGVSVAAALCAFCALLHGAYGCCTQEGTGASPWLSLTLLVAFIIVFFLLVTACILRVGLDALCASIQQSKRLASCAEAEHTPWVSYSPTRFYHNLYSAQASAWTNLFLWCLLTLRLFLQHRGIRPFATPPRNDPEAQAILGGR